ncbi:hypothetical protein ACFL0M_00380 [Thermodesulfobacteriota bacterium]
MPRRKGKSISFDAMVKFFMQHYNIPTKKDIDKLMARMDRLEDLIKTTAASGKYRRVSRVNATKGAKASGKSAMPASDKVMEIIKRFKQGAGFADIQSRTGYAEKKLRNIIFRLNKIGRIKRKHRGIYIAT